ncbi:hypothetical protein TNCV_135161 [Trichonephila clavipes]|nr:hypothetical protein TNCV_135161 [Trichonephila clavipes]
MSQSKAAIVAACLKLEFWYSEICNKMISRYHLTEELRWGATWRLEAGVSQIGEAGWLNESPSVFHRLW